MTFANALLDPETYVDPTRIGACPVITRYDDNLYFGGVMHGIALPPKILHLISFFPTQMYALGHPLRSIMFLPFNDSDDGLPPAPVLAGLARWVNTCRADAPTLVHCQAGLNRSPLVVALALVEEGMDPADAIRVLREQRDPKVLFRESFERWLMDSAVGLRT